MRNTLTEIFVESCKKYGKKKAFVDGQTGKEISYSKALVAALLLADKIKKMPGERLGVMIPTSAGGMLSIVATLMAGKVPVLINYATGAIKNSEYALKKCNLKVVLTAKALLQKLELKPTESMVMIEDVMASAKIMDKLKALFRSKKSERAILSCLPQISENDWAVMLLTTGSESEPKVVPLTHKNIVAQLKAIPKILDLTDKDIFLASLPLFHSFGFTTNFWLGISLGATMVTVANPLDYKLVCQVVPKYKVSFMTGTPVFFRAYMPKASGNTFDSVRIMIAGADKLPESVRKEYYERFGKELCEGYGVTEASPVVSTNRRGHHKPGSIGKVLPGVSVKVLARDTQEELPIGSEGRLLVKGDNVMGGYLVGDEINTDALQDGWYDTGDIALIDEDGYIWHRGRAKRFLKIGGEMISLVAVEEALQGFFAQDVHYCAVELKKEDGSSYVGLAVDSDCELLEIKKFLRNANMVALSYPGKIFVLDEIPIMGSGKVDFRAVQNVCNSMSAKS